jgi:hypothetical protein
MKKAKGTFFDALYLATSGRRFWAIGLLVSEFSIR